MSSFYNAVLAAEDFLNFVVAPFAEHRISVFKKRFG
jgi:hypothetical protein